MTVHSVFEDQFAPSLFEGINARYYHADEITKNFVPNAQFGHLAVRQHSLVVGPRGSGKTTLLRMLHPECLAIWDHEEAQSYRSRIDFSGIYVATDRVWRAQVESAAEGTDDSVKETFYSTIVAIDVMAAVLRTIELRLAPPGDAKRRFLAIEVSRQQLANLSAEIAGGWGLSPQFLSLGSVRVSLRSRRIDARRWARETSASGETPRPPWLGVPWDDALLLAIDAFESVTGVMGETWALLFDEAEIAPFSVRDSILRSTRGLDPRLIIKCSLSPWLQESPFALEAHDPTVFNDFNSIRLFYGKRAESYDFSRRLIRARLTSAGRTPPEDVLVEDAVFGPSRFVGEVEGRANRTAPAYTDTGPLGQVVKDLAELDPNFREWLRSQDIDPARLGDLSEARRARTLRKARNFMVARLEFRRESGLRSRKTIAMYAGGLTMLDICEGNPRLLLGLLLPLLEFYDGIHPLPDALQAEALSQIADDFYALIDAIPVSPEARAPVEFGRREVRNPYRELIQRIAKFFRDEILRGEFNPQPPTTFRVGRNASPALQNLVGRLVNVGAVILLTDRGIKDVIIGKFDQHRMRLCYLIAAREHLPPNVDRPVSILRILRAEPDEHDDFNSEPETLPGMAIDP